MAGHDASHIELVRRSRCHSNPYQSMMIHYADSQSIPVQALTPRSSARNNLDLLPVELINSIFMALDFQALRCLRLTSFAIKHRVEALPAYRDLVAHAPNTLRALAHTHLLSYFGATQLHDVLLSDRCASCNQYGGFLFLPTCQRCCVDCIADHPYMRIITWSSAKERFGEASLTGLCTMLSIPGRYGLDDQLHTDRHWLISMHAARMRSLGLSGREGEMNPSLKAELAKYAENKAISPDTLPGWQTLSRNEVAGENPRSSQALEEKWDLLEDAFRFMVATPFPSLNRHTRKIESGVRCLACLRFFWTVVGPGAAARSDVGRAMDMSFSDEEFPEHIKKCPLVMEYWDFCSRTIEQVTFI